jgi:hypothetical protein
MKIPKKIKIFGIEYNVVFTDNIQVSISKYLKENVNPKDFIGYFVSDPPTIFISVKSNQQVQEATFIHEVLEAIDHHLDINFEHNTIKRLETALYQILVENKLLK